MRGMGGILEAVVELLAELGIDVQPWTLSVVALAIMASLLPLILKNLRTSGAKKLKHARMLGGRDRLEAEAAALLSVEGQPMGLVAIADEAIRLGRRKLARQAVEQLRATGKQPGHLRRLTRELEPDDLPATVTAAALVIERLVESGLLDEAGRRLERATAKFGEGPELAETRARLAAARLDATRPAPAEPPGG